MTTSWPALALAGLVAGVSGTVTGVGSVFSYPVLLALGLPATSANVTNTVSLALGGAGGAISSRPELAGRARFVVPLCAAAVVGTAAGSVLLLLSPPRVFEVVVPFLVAGASVSILLPRPRRRAAGDAGVPRTALASMALVSVYNGYFAAGSAVLMIAALLATTTLALPTINGIKNLLVLASDLLAAATFAVFGPVAWGFVLPLALGLLVGTWLGPPLARRLPVAALRVVIALAGVGLALALGVEAFRPAA